MFSDEQLQQIKDHGLTPEEAEAQLSKFEQGVSFAKIDRPATKNDGIINLDQEKDEYIKLAERVIAEGKVLKFVPASGAATRMFKVLNASLNNKEVQEQHQLELTMFQEKIDKFPFYAELMKAIPDKGGLTLDDLLTGLLTDKGINYAHLPKGLIKFHAYDSEVRTAFEEHLVEAATYIKDQGNNVKVHFTVTPEHQELFEQLFEKVKDKYEKRYSAQFEITYSIQKSQTDTIAVDPDNKIFLSEGKFLFRPGGHGALINNLNDLQSAYVEIKNIDNIVPDRFKPVCIRYKKILLGYLSYLEQRIFKYLNAIADNSANYEEIITFAREKLHLSNADQENIKGLLNRPLRVCGMVKNEGEPGGGPFWIKDKEGSSSLQIIEADQIDPEKREAFLSKATHFNPVDMVCSLYDHQGSKFDLMQYIDETAFFITEKSVDGKPIKALERPGLWNGAMAKWNTVFVEVPLETFNPVKTVFDLLKPQHQPL